MLIIKSIRIPLREWRIFNEFFFDYIHANGER